MRRYTTHCEGAITSNHPQGMVDNTSQVAAFHVDDHYIYITFTIHCRSLDLVTVY